MKKIAIIISVLFIFSCNSTENKEQETQTSENKEVAETNINSEAYNLMKQKCMICHFEKPSFENKGKMTAPPLLRIKEHYLPSFPKKEDFINAILDFSKNPTEEKVMMPGSVKKFNLMPKLGYTDEDLKIIAEFIYETDFGTAKRKKRMNSQELNNDKKWKLKPETIQQIKEITVDISNFNSENIKDYNKFGTDIFNKTKLMMLDKDYDEATSQQIRIFFHGIEDDMHTLMGIENIEDAKTKVSELKVKFDNFFNYFE